MVREIFTRIPTSTVRMHYQLRNVPFYITTYICNCLHRLYICTTCCNEIVYNFLGITKLKRALHVHVYGLQVYI